MRCRHRAPPCAPTVDGIVKKAAPQRLSGGGAPFKNFARYLLAQNLARHLLDRAARERAELEWAVAQADQARDLPAEMLADAPDLAVLALAQREDDPRIGALLPLERRLDRAI